MVTKSCILSIVKVNKTELRGDRYGGLYISLDIYPPPTPRQNRCKNGK
jgi:hypothetical protein